MDNIYFAWFKNGTILPLVRRLNAKDICCIMDESQLFHMAQGLGLGVEVWNVEGIEHIERDHLSLVHSIDSELIKAGYSPEFRKNAYSLFRNAMEGLATFDCTRKAKDVKVLVQAADCLAHQRPVLELARRYGIPSVHIMHGCYFEVTPWVVAGELRHCYSDTTCVFGQQDKDILVEHGNDPDKILVTGSPFWDSLYKPRVRMSKEEARRQLGLPMDRPVVLLLSTHTEPTWNWADWLRQQHACHREVIKQCKELNAVLVVRPHPLEVNPQAHPDILRRVIGRYEHVVKSEGVDVYVELKDRNVAVRACDVCVFPIPSSAMVECMILERPIALYGSTPGCNTTYLYRDGIEVGELKLGEKIDQSDMIVGKQSKSLPYLNHMNDGKSSDRIADLISSLI